LGSGEAYLSSQLIRPVVLPKGFGVGRLGNGSSRLFLRSNRVAWLKNVVSRSETAHMERRKGSRQAR
jgi:hypothetical protein